MWLTGPSSGDNGNRSNGNTRGPQMPTRLFEYLVPFGSRGDGIQLIDTRHDITDTMVHTGQLNVQLVLECRDFGICHRIRVGQYGVVLHQARL